MLSKQSISIISRWLPQPPRLVQHVSPPSLTRAKVSMPHPSATFRRAFTFPTGQSSFLPSRANPRVNNIRILRTRQSSGFRRFFNTSRPMSSPQSDQTGSLSQRLKALSREYGWSALWVYLLLSAMDFPICFAAVRFLGAEKIGHYEHAVIETCRHALGTIFPNMQEEFQSQETGGLKVKDETGEISEGQAVEGAQKRADEGASLWTQVALAYAIHKSLIFIRVPLTAGITPKVVRVLRQWGWDIVKGRPKGM
ncbi:hypothetical protein BDV25DRAFT_66970 [Aspergillus avenaceus]|uniref:DUF1279 domain-containing protein n=1 Tax=Aspergillus avenaceus TaxID=36643 RepID=A0A5N6THM5_ASPAV|nr:hypothetical protein BDV25DRAFT_66970 [Aspergillus avenaceus]